MRKAINYIILAVLLFFFLFDSEVQAADNLSFNVSFDTVQRTLYRHEWRVTESPGYGILVDNEREFTLSFESSINIDNIGGQDPKFLYDYIMNNYPQVYLNHDGTNTDMDVEEIRVYFNINGTRYEIPAASSALYHAAACNKIGIIVEADIRAYTYYHADIPEVHITATCSDIGGSIVKAGESEYSMLDELRNSNINTVTWQENIYALFSSIKLSLEEKLDTLHADNNAISDLLASILYQVCEKLDSLNAWMQTTAQTLSDFKNSAIEWYQQIHVDITDMMNNLWTIYDDLKSYLGAWFDRQHQDMLDLGEKLTNGFDGSDGDEVLGDIEDVTGGLTEAEDELIDSSLDDLGDYTIDENGIAGMFEQYAMAISLVSAMTQSFYESMGEFGYTIAVGFTCVIVCMCIGLFRFRGK